MYIFYCVFQLYDIRIIGEKQMKSIIFFILFKYDRLYHILKIFKKFYNVCGMFLQVLQIVSYTENILNIYWKYSINFMMYMVCFYGSYRLYHILKIFKIFIMSVVYFCMSYRLYHILKIYWKYSKIFMMSILCFCRSYRLYHILKIY